MFHIVEHPLSVAIKWHREGISVMWISGQIREEKRGFIAMYDLQIYMVGKVYVAG